MSLKTALHARMHPEFSQLLNFSGSMTQQLEALGQLSVNLLTEDIEQAYFRRYSILQLNNRAVIASCSSTLLTHEVFCQLLSNANTIPIGKFLFAPQTLIQRQNDMLIEPIVLGQIAYPTLAAYFKRHNYDKQQPLWQRKSTFTYQHERLDVTEILLPELKNFFAQLT